MNTFNISLEIDKSSPLSPEGIAIRQGDVNGTTLIATIYDHGTKLATTGLTPYLIMELPDHEHSYSQAGTYSNGVVTVIINEKQAASVSGVVENAYIELRQSSTTIASTESFRVVIRPDARADKEIGETYSSEIEAAIQELENAIAQAETQIEADVAEWLDQHPEATTTVQDGSITYAKLHSSTKQRLNNKLHRLVTAPVVTASDAYAAPPVALVVDGKSVQDGTPTPSAPVAIQSVESVGLAAAGRNLLPYPYYDGSTHTSNGVTFTVNSDGSLHVQGTAAATTYYNFAHHSQGHVWTPGTYTISVESPLPTGTSLYFGLRIDGVNKQGSNIRSGDSQNLWTTQDVGLFRGYLTVEAGATVDTTIYVQIELGSTATPYQPYVGSTTAIPLQGHALRSLPDGTHDELMVDADGNVTLVQRVLALTIDGTNYRLFHNTGTGSYCQGGYSVMRSEPTSGASLAAMSDHFPRAVANASCYVAAKNFIIRYGGTFNPADQSELDAWFQTNPTQIMFALETPQEISLGTVTLPSMPAPYLTAWASCTPATEIGLDYERDVSLVIAALEAQIAEIATA